mgnify:CR=1 FL=1
MDRKTNNLHTSRIESALSDPDPFHVDDRRIQPVCIDRLDVETAWTAMFVECVRVSGKTYLRDEAECGPKPQHPRQQKQHQRQSADVNQCKVALEPAMREGEGLTRNQSQTTRAPELIPISGRKAENRVDDRIDRRAEDEWFKHEMHCICKER